MARIKDKYDWDMIFLFLFGFVLLIIFLMIQNYDTRLCLYPELNKFRGKVQYEIKQIIDTNRQK